MTTAHDQQPDEPSDYAFAGDTTLHVRRALEGDQESLSWVVGRFSPLLRAQAAHRLGPVLSRQLDPDDILAEAWLVVLGRLKDIAGREGHSTPRLLAFISETIRRIINHQLDLSIRRKDLVPDSNARSGSTSSGADPIALHAADITGVITHAMRDERNAAVEACLAQLQEPDREILILRGIEGCTNQETADELNEPPNTVSHRYLRALEKLRNALPNSIFDELADA